MVKRIKLRIDTAANFALANPVLRNGETAIEIHEDGSRKMKTGNGYTPWLELPYLVDDDKYDSILQQLEEYEADHGNRLETLEQTAELQEAAITELQQETEEQQATLEQVAQSVNAHAEHLSETEAKNQEQDRSLESLNSRMAILEDPRLIDETVAELKEKDQQLEQRLDTLDADNQQRDAALAAIKTKNTDQDTMIETLGNGVTDFGERLLSVETAQGGFDNKFQALQDNAESQKSRIDALEASAAGNPADIGALQHQIIAVAETLNTETLERNGKDRSHDDALDTLAAAVTQEKRARIDQDNNLASLLEGAVTELKTALEQEATERTEDGANLEAALEQETQDRSEADSALEQAILEIAETTEQQAAALEIETQERLVADEALQEQLTAVHESLQEHVVSTNNPHEVTKAQIGLSSVNNTPDTDKPVSTAQAAAIAAALSASQAYTLEQIEAFIRNTLHYLGNVATYADLPENPELFDLWHILDTGKGYYWFGDEWNILDFSIDLTQYYTAEETEELLETKVSKETGKGLSTNDFTDALLQMLQAVVGDLKVFHDAITHQSDIYEDILVTRYMLRSNLSVTNSTMEINFDRVKLRVVATSTSNLRTEVLSAVSGTTVTVTIRRNTFYNNATEGQTIQNRVLNDTPYVIDNTIYVDSNDYSIYQLFIEEHWWEINLWPANNKSVVLMSLERRL